MDKNELLNEIKIAMKEKDKVKLSILRQVNQAIKQIEVDEKREIEATDFVSIVKKLQKITNEEVESLEKAAAEAHAERLESLKRQADILTGLLPEQLSGDKLEELCVEAIEELGAETRRDMGKVMGYITEATNGNFDKAQAAKFIGSKLS